MSEPMRFSKARKEDKTDGNCSLPRNEMSLLSAILEPGIPAGEHRGELQEYINNIRMQRVKDGTITQAGEDPLLTFGRIKKQNAGGQTI